MEKRVYSNGFTMVEVLLVLLIVLVLSLASVQVRTVDSLSVFMEKMMAKCVLLQEEAFITKETKYVQIMAHGTYFDDEYFEYPSSISCSSISFFYNAKGNISMANTLTCSNTNSKRKLIFQLGSGRVRLE